MRWAAMWRFFFNGISISKIDYQRRAAKKKAGGALWAPSA
jgi:hypothetical protein